MNAETYRENLIARTTGRRKARLSTLMKEADKHQFLDAINISFGKYKNTLGEENRYNTIFVHFSDEKIRHIQIDQDNILDDITPHIIGRAWAQKK